MSNRVAVVTGTSRGIGHAMAVLLLEKGWQVVGTSTSGTGPIEHDYFHSIALDLAKSDSIAQFAAQTQSLVKKIDLLVNNAGILLESWSTDKVDVNILRRTFEVNVFGTIDLTERLVPALDKGGKIINLSSAWGTFSDTAFSAHVPHYKMSKTALNMYSKLLAARLAKETISVYAVNPGWVRTDMGTHAAPKSPQAAALDLYHMATHSEPSGTFFNGHSLGQW
ncbi:MAG: SDR family NAD(P)-dependent oxidoreductase [Saprospiraceae bacterium]|nr:SDR family NAD(P)-dependent oxidoreductase [Saprospiraceae bacterium]